MKPFFSLFLYRFFLLLLTPLILLVFIIRSKNNPLFRQRLLERLGLLPHKVVKRSIIIHAASVGEVIAIKQFVELLLTQNPTTTVTITTFTPTGSAQVKKQFGERVQHYYLPLDNFISTALFLWRLQPKAIVFMETELWPNLVAQAVAKKIPLLLINGRLSAKSCRQYQKISALIRPCVQRFDHILTQSKAHQSNFIRLGASEVQCTVSGNLKYDVSITKDITDKSRVLTQFIENKRPVWLVASTHRGDDELVLGAFKKIKQQLPQLLLLLVPRHPERFDDVAKLCNLQAFTLARRSRGEKVTAVHDIWLLDTLGELVPAYSLADVVTIAGTFSHIGGHNPLEAALFKKPIVLGADMANFTEVLAQLKQANAVLQLADNNQVSEDLASIIKQLFNDNKQQKKLGENSYQVVLNNQGASKRSLDKLIELVG